MFDRLDRQESGGGRAGDVARGVVADHGRAGRVGVQRGQSRGEHPRVGLVGADLLAGDDRVEDAVQAQPLELAQLHAGDLVGDQREGPAAGQAVEGGVHVGTRAGRVEASLSSSARAAWQRPVSRSTISLKNSTRSWDAALPARRVASSARTASWVAPKTPADSGCTAARARPAAPRPAAWHGA